MESVKQSTQAASDRLAKLQLPGMKPAVPVVEVREADLEKMPLGHEKALAYEKKRKSFWSFRGPIDFKEPSMPEVTLEADGSLLPPLTD